MQLDSNSRLLSPIPYTASLAKWLRRPPLEWKIRGSNPACDGIFLGRVIPVTLKLALRWLPCLAPGIIGSALGLVGPVSVYCDWVRWKVGSATSISGWQHVELSEQIRPRDTLACCWDVSDLKFGTPVTTLPGAWRYSVSDGTGWPGVSIL